LTTASDFLVCAEAGSCSCQWFGDDFPFGQGEDEFGTEACGLEAGVGEAEAAGGVVASSASQEGRGHVDFFGEVDGTGDDYFGVFVVFDFCDCFFDKGGVCCLLLFIVDCDGMWRIESRLREEEGGE